MKAIIAAILAGAITLLSSITPVSARDALRVCLNENIPLYSVRKEEQATGFDVMVAQAIAKRLHRPLEIQWFETKLEADSSLTIEANTLLSDGRCHLVAGYPLIKGTLGKPRVDTGKMADFAGAKAGDRRRRVVLGELMPTRPYHRAPLVVVVNGAAVQKPVTALADLKNLRIAIHGSTLADAILMSHREGFLVGDITHLAPGRENLLGRLDAGDFDATLVPLHQFDAYRAATPTTRLKATGYQHRVGFNMGLVGLASQADLIASVNAALADMGANGELKALAEGSGLTFVAPQEPFVGDNIRLSDLGEH